MTVDLLKNLLDSAEGKENGESGKFFFGHSETFLPLLAQLGVAKDEVRSMLIVPIIFMFQPSLSIENMPENRLWRTSLIGGNTKNSKLLKLQFQESHLILP